MAHPVRVFIVRHGERQDQANPGFAKSTRRPHDPPLSLDGVQQARRLGRFLSTQSELMRASADGELVVTSSPLLRCLQTAACMIEGMHRGPGTPIYVEPDLTEVAASVASDWRRNPSLGDRLPDPLWMPRDVAQTRLAVSDATSVLQPSLLGCTGTSFLSRDESGQVTHDQHERRATRVLAEVLAIPALSGKTIVIVTHAHLALSLRQCVLSHRETPETFPELTSFVCFDVVVTPTTGSLRMCRALQSDFAAPHLSVHGDA